MIAICDSGQASQTARAISLYQGGFMSFLFLDAMSYVLPAAKPRSFVSAPPSSTHELQCATGGPSAQPRTHTQGNMTREQQRHGRH